MTFLSKILTILFTIKFLFFTSVFAIAANDDFYTWLIKYKKNAVKKGISHETVNIAFKNVKYLEQVIKYDRKQPEFYEDTITYISKRATSNRAKKAKELLSKNKSLFLKIEREFDVEKEILLSLWGIETNFGKHVGKMDIISSLATLSYDKRRRVFFFITIIHFIEID